MSGMGLIFAFIATALGLVLGTRKASASSLKDTPPKSGSGMTDYSVSTWEPIIGVLASLEKPPISIPYALEWISIESGGNPCAIGDLVSGPDGYPQEMGIAQIYNPDYLPILHVTSRELRAYCGPGYSSKTIRQLTAQEMTVQARVTIDLIKYCKENSGHYLIQAGTNWNENSKDFWMMVKLWHALPSLVRALPQVTAKLGRPPIGWSEYKATMIASGTPGYGSNIPNATPAQLRSMKRALKSFSNSEQCGNAFVPFPTS